MLTTMAGLRCARRRASKNADDAAMPPSPSIDERRSAAISESARAGLDRASAALPTSGLAFSRSSFVPARWRMRVARRDSSTSRGDVMRPAGDARWQAEGDVEAGELLAAGRRGAARARADGPMAGQSSTMARWCDSRRQRDRSAMVGCRHFEKVGKVFRALAPAHGSSSACASLSAMAAPHNDFQGTRALLVRFRMAEQRECVVRAAGDGR